MGYSMKNEAIDTIKRAFNLHEYDQHRSEYIRDHFDYAYEKSWHCVIGRTLCNNVYYSNNDFMCSYIGNREMLLFRRG